MILAIGSTEAAPLSDPDARAVIVGTGLMMVDKVLSLLASGHRWADRGLVAPQSAAARSCRDASDPPDRGRPAPPRQQLPDFRLDTRPEAAGGTWQDAMDRIRQHVTALWRVLPEVKRRHFLQHAATWWDVHRNRMPPAFTVTMQAALARGQLTLLHGAYRSATAADSP